MKWCSFIGLKLAQRDFYIPLRLLKTGLLDGSVKLIGGSHCRRVCGFGIGSTLVGFGDSTGEVRHRVVTREVKVKGRKVQIAAVLERYS